MFPILYIALWQLQMKEAKRDAAELQDDGGVEAEIGDTAYSMRKVRWFSDHLYHGWFMCDHQLLRRFSDLMASNSLEGTEECPVCMEKLEVNTSVGYAHFTSIPQSLTQSTNSFPCQHILCETCYGEISRNKELINCPQCRHNFTREDIETIQYTASSQWDALLNVAAGFAKIDHRGAEDTSEEEASERFIDDEESELTLVPMPSTLISSLTWIFLKLSILWVQVPRCPWDFTWTRGNGGERTLHPG